MAVGMGVCVAGREVVAAGAAGVTAVADAGLVATAARAGDGVGAALLSAQPASRSDIISRTK
jgi:hypothetical protein